MKERNRTASQITITNFQNGSQITLAYLFDLHHKALCYFGFSIIGDMQQAQDVVSESYVKLWQRRSDFESFSQVKSFLFLTCKNACLNAVRDGKRNERKKMSYYLDMESQEEATLNKMIRAEVLSFLYEEIELLPQKCQQVFKLIYFENKSTNEIAELLAVSVQTVRNQKTRAKELLRSSLLKKGISELLFYAMIVWSYNN